MLAFLTQKMLEKFLSRWVELCNCLVNLIARERGKVQEVLQLNGEGSSYACLYV
jgi:hypothetical protein